MKEFSSPADMVYPMFEISGMMVRPKSKVRYLVLANICLQCSNLVIFACTTFMSLLSDSVNFGGKLECAQHFVSNLHITSKHFNIVLHRKGAIKFFTLINEMWTDWAPEPEFRHLFRAAHKVSMKMTISMCLLYNGLIPVNILLWAFTNYYLLPDVESLPMPILVPFDAHDHFWLASFYQLFIFHSPLLSVGMSVALVTIITEQVSAQMKVLQILLESRKKNDNDTYLKIYKQHQKVIRLVKEYNAFFSGQYCFEMAMSSLQIAIRAYTCLWGIKTGNVMVVAFFLLIVLTTVAPYVICSCGSEIVTQSEKIHRSAYQNEWYLEQTKSRKDLVMLLTSASEPLHLHYKQFIVFSMEQFTKLMQATYSYIAMIRHIDA